MVHDCSVAVRATASLVADLDSFARSVASMPTLENLTNPQPFTTPRTSCDEPSWIARPHLDTSFVTEESEDLRDDPLLIFVTQTEEEWQPQETF